MTWNEPTALEDFPEEQHQHRERQRQQVQQQQRRNGNASGAFGEGQQDFAFLHQLLYQHVVHLKNEGVPLQEIENFLSDKRAVKSFFESRGCQFQARRKSGKYFRIVNRRVVIESDTSDDDDDDEDEEVEGQPKDPPTAEEEEATEEVTQDKKEAEEKEDDNDAVEVGEKTPISEADTGDVEQPSKVEGWSLSTGLSWLRRRALLNFQRLILISKYIFAFATVAFVAHFGICHLLDVNPLQFWPSLMERRCLIPTHPIIMEMTRPIADCRFCQESQDDADSKVLIEMNELPNKTEFAKVAYLSKPVIIRGGAENGGMPVHFSFKQLKAIFESEPGGVDAVSEECQFLPFRSPFGSLKEAFEKIGDGAGGKGKEWPEPWYIGWSNCHPGVAAKLRELFPRPGFLPDDSSSSAIDWIFIGSPGLGASMHIDYVKRPSWQAQLAGVKRWLLHPPPECEAVCPNPVRFTIYPGDLLFLETNTWYHQTFIEGDAFSISIGSEYD